MPKLIRLYIRHTLIGFGVAAVFVAALLWLNVANLGQLIANSDVPVMATALLVLFNGIVFSGVQFAIAIMNLAEDPEPPAPRQRITPDTVPVRISTEDSVTGPPQP